MTKPPSLRQRKKDLTRNQLIEVSQRLFRKQGYDATTLEQICAEAVVSVPTLLVYFESKERLALAPDYDLLARFKEQIDDPERTDDTLTVWRNHIEGGAGFADRDRRDYLRYMKFLKSNPVLSRGVLSLLQQYEEVLAEGLAVDYGTDAHTDLTTRLLATMLSFGNQAAVRQWEAAGGTGDLTQAAVAVVDFAIEHFPKPGQGLTGARAKRPAAG